MKSIFLSICAKNRVFIVLALLFFALIFILENINGRFWLNDFKVYYLAADALLNGRAIYGEAFGLGTGFYKYSPFVLMGFVPYSLLPFYAASVIHYCIIALAAIATIFCVQIIMKQYVYATKRETWNTLLFIGLLSILFQIFRELHLGNVNMILLCILCFALLSALMHRSILSGILIGIAILFKPYFILLLLPLLMHKKFKIILSIGLTLCVSVIIVLLFFGWTRCYDLHFAWLQSMLDHNVLLSSSETIVSILRYYVYPALANTYQFYVLAIVLLLYLSFFLYQKRTNTESVNKEQQLIFSYFVLIGLIPNLLITDTEHFMFSLPIILFILNYVTFQKKWYYKLLCLILIFFFAGNSPDILGKTLSNQFSQMGVLGLSNLVWIGLSLWFAFRAKAKPEYI